MRRLLATIAICGLLAGCAGHGASFGKTNKQKAISAAAFVVMAPPALVGHVSWTVYGILAWPFAKLMGEQEQVPIWWSAQVGPTYASTKWMGHWGYYGAEPEHRESALSIPRGGEIGKTILLRHVEHEDGAFTCCRTSASPTWNMGGAETRPLAP